MVYSFVRVRRDLPDAGIRAFVTGIDIGCLFSLGQRIQQLLGVPRIRDGSLRAMPKQSGRGAAVRVKSRTL
jgi:uncharacterized protein YneF (UPF0154 family)